MTRISRNSFIAITFAAAGFAMFSQGASASTANSKYSATSHAQMLKYCARLGNQDNTGCREAVIRIKQRRLVELVKEGGGGNGGNGGNGGRGGRK